MAHREEPFNCIALDMGAGSIRLMHGYLDGERISYRDLERFPNGPEFIDGHDRWNMARIVREIKGGVDRVIRQAAVPFQSIGVDSWGVDYVLLDENDELVETPVAYRDRRTEGQREVWNRWMSERETFRRTGINYNIFNTLYQLLASKDSETMKRAARILFIPGYLHQVLSGSAMNELTISSTSQLLSVEDNQWDREILNHLRLDPGMLGEVVDPGTILGNVYLPALDAPTMASVAVCGHDTASVVTSIPADHPDFAYISAGTWCIVGVESVRPLLSDEALNLGITNERGFGNTYRALKNITGLWLLQGLKQHLPADYTFSKMEQMIPEGSRTPLVIHPEDPVFYHPADMKVAFDSFYLDTGQEVPDDFHEYIQCAYDSICFSFRYYLEKLEHLRGKSIEVIHVLGGGSQSRYLNQRIATICERRVIAGPVEGATLGNILVQALALGWLKDLTQGRELVKRSCQVQEFQPEVMNPELSDRYAFFLTLKNVKSA